MSRILLSLTGKVKEFVDDAGNKYKLIGDCSRCGECCKIPNPISETTPCKFLDENMNCKIYESRPIYCVLFPRTPATQTFETCSLKWQQQ